MRLKRLNTPTLYGEIIHLAISSIIRHKDSVSHSKLKYLDRNSKARTQINK